MAIRSGFFNSINGDRKYDAGKFAEYFASFIGNGVFPNPASGLQVMANDDMTVTVKAGKAWINGYILINDDDYILTLDPADGVLNRIDRIVARYDTVDREIRLEVKKGTFASQPVAPGLQRDADAYELGLADIYVAAGAVSISQANITDLRMNSNYCGIVAGTVDQIDTTGLFAQYQAAFEEWFQTLQDVLDDNTAANLLNLINQNSAAIATKADRADLEELQQEVDEHLADTAQNAHLAKNISIEDTAGHFTATNVEGALNELFQSVSDGKNLIATAITDKGVPASGGDTFSVLANKIEQIAGLPITLAAGSELIAQHNIEKSTQSGTFTYTKVKELQLFNVKGTVRVSYNLRTGTRNRAAQGRIHINGVPVGIERTIPSETYDATFTEDFTINEGDLLQLYIRTRPGDDPARAYTALFEVRADIKLPIFNL